MFKKLALTTLAIVALASSALASGGAMSLIPNDAVTVGVVKLGVLRTSPLSSMLFQQTDKVSTDGDAEKFLRETGLKPSKDIDLLVVATTPKTALGSEANVLVAAEGRFDVARLTAALMARGAVQKNGYLLITDTKKNHGDNTDKPGAVAFVDAGLALAGTEEAVVGALASRAAGGTTFLASSGLGREIARIDPNASAWAVVDVARASRLSQAPRVPSHNGSATALQGAVKNLSTVALWATDAGDSLKLGAFGMSSDEETLGLLEDTIRGALAAMRLAAQDKAPDMVSVLRKFSVTRDAEKVQITGSIPAETMQKFLAKQKEQHAHATQ